MTYDDYLDLEEKRKEDCWERFDYDLTFVVQFEKDNTRQLELIDAYDIDKAFNEVYKKIGGNLQDVEIIGIFDGNDMSPTTFDGTDVLELFTTTIRH